MVLSPVSLQGVYIACWVTGPSNGGMNHKSVLFGSKYTVFMLICQLLESTEAFFFTCDIVSCGYDAIIFNEVSLTNNFCVILSYGAIVLFD